MYTPLYEIKRFDVFFFYIAVDSGILGNFAGVEPTIFREMENRVNAPFRQFYRASSVAGQLSHEFGYINGVDNVNWPPYRDSKS